MSFTGDKVEVKRRDRRPRREKVAAKLVTFHEDIRVTSLTTAVIVPDKKHRSTPTYPDRDSSTPGKTGRSGHHSKKGKKQTEHKGDAKTAPAGNGYVLTSLVKRYPSLMLRLAQQLLQSSSSYDDNDNYDYEEGDNGACHDCEEEPECEPIAPRPRRGKKCRQNVRVVVNVNGTSTDNGGGGGGGGGDGENTLVSLGPLFGVVPSGPVSGSLNAGVYLRQNGGVEATFNPNGTTINVPNGALYSTFFSRTALRNPKITAMASINSLGSTPEGTPIRLQFAFYYTYADDPVQFFRFGSLINGDNVPAEADASLFAQTTYNNSLPGGFWYLVAVTSNVAVNLADVQAFLEYQV